MKPPARGWIVSDDTGERYEQAGEFPVLKLKDFIHDYDLETRGLTPPVRLSVRFGFYSKEFYAKAGRTQPDNYWLISAGVPVGKFRQRPLSYWIDTFPYVDDMEKEEARLILREQMGITGTETALEKIDKICAYQVALYAKQAGTPDDRMKVETSPLKILNRVRAGDGKIWCTQMAMIYHFFANLAGIPTRLITLEGHIDQTITTGHSFAESFIPERGGWARVDPSANKFYVWNRENRLLNSADILHAALNGSVSDLKARTLKDGEVVTVPYGEVNASDLQLFSPGAQLIFRRGSYAADETIGRYLFSPNLGYSLDAAYAVRLYRLRRALFGAWIILLAGAAAFLLGRPRRQLIGDGPQGGDALGAGRGVAQVIYPVEQADDLPCRRLDRARIAAVGVRAVVGENDFPRHVPGLSAVPAEHGAGAARRVPLAVSHEEPAVPEPDQVGGMLAVGCHLDRLAPA